MSYDIDQIDQLIAEEIAGIISRDDWRILNQAIIEHREVHQMWLRRRKRFESRASRLWLMTGTITQKRKRSPHRKTFLYAVIIALVIGSGVAAFHLRMFSNTGPGGQRSIPDSLSLDKGRK